jgi:hypothetical protein
MRDEKVTREPEGRLFQEPTGYDRTPTEQIPVPGRTETLAAEPLPEPLPGEDRDTPGDRTVTGDLTPGDRSDTVDAAGPDAAGTAGPTSVDNGAGRTGTDRLDGRADGDVDDRVNDGVDAPAGDRVDDRTDAGTGSTPDAAPAARDTASTTGKHGNGDDDPGAVLFGDDVATGFRDRWRELQADFVDDPKRAVEGADQLVDEVMRELTESHNAHKSTLSGQWQSGEGDTEELRRALRKYRSFLDQLLHT